MGYITPRGKYVILRNVGGKQFERSTGQIDETRAIIELARFEDDPENYRPSPPPEKAKSKGPPPIYLTPELIDEHVEWAKGVGKITSPEWERAKRWLLEWWMTKLHRVNLRKGPRDQTYESGKPSPIGLDLATHILGAVDEKNPKTGKPVVGSRKHRLAVIVSLYSWLREKAYKLEPDEDPTFGRGLVPTNKPEQDEDTNKTIPLKDILKIIEYWKALPVKVNGSAEADARIVAGRIYSHVWKAHVLELMLATAWHFKAVCKFVDPQNKHALIIDEQHPWFDPEIQKELPGGCVVRVNEKRGLVYVRISARARAAAEALRARGKISDQQHFYAELRKACEAKKVTYFTPGRIRHTVLTLAKNKGEDTRKVMTFANHADESTHRVYTLHAVPAKIWTAV